MMMMMMIKNWNYDTFFCQLSEFFKSLKIVYSYNINTEIIVGAILVALIIGILYMNIESLLNPLAEISEAEKNRRRWFKLSDKICGQILHNKRRALNNQSPLSYNEFGPLFGHLTNEEQLILVEIMRQKPSSHIRFTFPYVKYHWNAYFLVKHTRERPSADWSMYIAAVEWEKGIR